MKAADVKLIGVLGMGVMGSGIPQPALMSRFNVIVHDLTEEILTQGKTILPTGVLVLRVPLRAIR